MNVCIVGSGYVGLVSAACFAEMGNTVVCVDVNPDVVAALSQGKIHIYEPGLDDLVKRNHAEGRLSFTTELSEGMKDALFVFITVGTPPREDGSCDLCYVEEVARQIGDNMKQFVVVVDKSTVPVGTADLVKSIIAERLAARGEHIEFDVVSNPEFLKEGDAINDFMKPDRVVVGTENIRTAELMKALYAPFARSRDKLITMSVRSAEVTKYAANCLLATKISFINEIANLCDIVGADINEVRSGIGSDHRIGYHFIYPGVGYGGSCFPKDVKALINVARNHEMTPTLLEAVDKVNIQQKRLLAEKIEKYFSGELSGLTLALWGIAFKANTDDTREAPSFDIIKYLTERGMRIQAFDPVAGEVGKKQLAGNKMVKVFFDQYSVFEGADAMAVVTEWNQFRNPDFARIKKDLSKAVVFDGRNLYSPEMLGDMGFDYIGIGRRQAVAK